MIRCKNCRLSICTCGKEDWEEYQTGGEAKALVKQLTEENALLRDAIIEIKKWTERWTSPSHPIVTFANKALKGKS